MADTFPLSGNIDPKSFPFLLVDLYRRGATGSLKVEGPQHPKALYFRGGRVLFGSSNDPKDQLGAILIENGKITKEQLDDVNTKVGPGNPLAKVLAESGYVNQRELGEAARVKVERILSDVIAYGTGSFEFEDGVLPKGAVDLKLSTEKLLLAAVARIGDRGFALRHLQSLGVVLAPAPDWEAQVAEIRTEAGGLLERLDGQRSLKDAVALTRFEEFEGAKIACGLLFLGLATKAGVLAAPATGGDELDLGDTARVAFADAPFFTPDSPFAEPLRTAELPSIPYGEPEAPAFVTDAAGSPPIEGLLAEPAPPTVVMPGIDSPFSGRAEPTGFSFSEPSGFAMSEGAEIGFASTEPAVQAPFSPPSGTPPTTAELPALGVASPNESRTVPGFRVPAGAPPAPIVPPVEPDDAVSVPPSRPSKEDLAALDALLNPSGSILPSASMPAASMNPSASMRMRATTPRPQPQRWEPQFRPPSASGARRPARASRLPLVTLLAAALLIAAVSAGGYYFVFLRPAQTATPGGSVASSSPAPPPTVAPTPPPVASPLSTPALVPETAPPSTAPPAIAPPVTTTPASAGGDARSLLRRGSFPEAAHGFASEVKRAGPRFSVQVLVACSTETIQKALDNVRSDEIFILPVNYRGKGCYRLCWGLYESQDRATAALLSLPEYFRQGGASPKVSPAASLLP